MAKANCSTCGGEINTESSPTGKCVRCVEAESRQVPLAVTTPKAAAPAELPLSAATEKHDVPGVGTLHTTRAPDGSTYAAIVPPHAEVGAVPAVEHETPKAHVQAVKEDAAGEHRHEHAKPHGKKHGG
jgi:hypothetical protein